VELADAYCSIWSAIVREYSRSALTFPGDKMVAISGIAKHLRSAMKDEYVAGMWRSHLEHWLLWWVKGPRSTEGAAWPSSRPSTYRAPTWSWASVDGAVVIPLTSYESKLEFHVSDFKLDYATEDTTGAITGGWMDLTASLKPIRLLQQSPDDLLSWDIAMSGTALGRRDGLYIEFDVPPSSNDAFDTDNAEKRLFCVLSQTTNLQSDYVFILLLRLIDTEKMLYERFGRTSRMRRVGMSLLEISAKKSSRIYRVCGTKMGCTPFESFSTSRYSVCAKRVHCQRSISPFTASMVAYQ
jgi:hypothetical protein